ncbi:MAG TPA: superoxide dismutase [Ni] [Gammaproteobacteria bacterium]|nr:superoxide dismutase [Ni] [Gammaproteobacteria bacterium]
MRKSRIGLLGLVAVSVMVVIATSPRLALTHCQMPCGIYDDASRVQAMREDVTTIEKAVTSITELAGKTDAQSINQITRWVSAKEDYASAIITTIAEYFLTQRVKPIAPGEKGHDTYLKSLSDHHAVMVAAMKVKQNTDPKFVASLKEAVDTLSKYYEITGH